MRRCKGAGFKDWVSKTPTRNVPKRSASAWDLPQDGFGSRFEHACSHHKPRTVTPPQAAIKADSSWLAPAGASHEFRALASFTMFPHLPTSCHVFCSGLLPASTRLGLRNRSPAGVTQSNTDQRLSNTQHWKRRPETIVCASVKMVYLPKKALNFR